MSPQLVILNRQRAVPVNLRLMRRLAQVLISDLMRATDYAVGICLVDLLEMARLNETFLQHHGSTDVITFDYSRGRSKSAPIRPPKWPPGKTINGEMFICTGEAIVHSRRFRTSWQMELARYVIHGVLHLCDFDDLRPGDRRVMKREEDRLLRELSRKLPLPDLKRSRPASRKIRTTRRRTRTHRRFPLSKRSRNPRLTS